MATYDNPILNFAERYPMAGFFVLPVAIHYGAVWVSAIVRKGKTGSYLGNLFGETHQESLRWKRYQNRGRRCRRLDVQSNSKHRPYSTRDKSG